MGERDEIGNGDETQALGMAATQVAPHGGDAFSSAPTELALGPRHARTGTFTDGTPSLLRMGATTGVNPFGATEIAASAPTARTSDPSTEAGLKSPGSFVDGGPRTDIEALMTSNRQKTDRKRIIRWVAAASLAAIGLVGYGLFKGKDADQPSNSPVSGSAAPLTDPIPTNDSSATPKNFTEGEKRSNHLRQKLGNFIESPFFTRHLTDTQAAIHKMHWVNDIPQMWKTAENFRGNGGSQITLAISLPPQLSKNLNLDHIIFTRPDGKTPPYS